MSRADVIASLRSQKQIDGSNVGAGTQKLLHEHLAHEPRRSGDEDVAVLEELRYAASVADGWGHLVDGWYFFCNQ